MHIENAHPNCFNLFAQITASTEISDLVQYVEVSQVNNGPIFKIEIFPDNSPPTGAGVGSFLWEPVARLSLYSPSSGWHEFHTGAFNQAEITARLKLLAPVAEELDTMDELGCVPDGNDSQRSSLVRAVRNILSKEIRHLSDMALMAGAAIRQQ